VVQNFGRALKIGIKSFNLSSLVEKGCWRFKRFVKNFSRTSL